MNPSWTTLEQKKEIEALKTALRETRRQGYRLFNIQREREILARRREDELTADLKRTTQSVRQLGEWLSTVAAASRDLWRHRALAGTKFQALAEFLKNYDSWHSTRVSPASTFDSESSRERAEDLDEALRIPFLTPTVEVVVVVEKDHSQEWVQACLESIREKSPRLNRIVVVHGGEVDQKVASYIGTFAGRGTCPVLPVVRSEPLAPSHAANLGLRAAQGDYVILLGSNIVVSHGWMEYLIFCGNSDPETGVVGPLSTVLPEGASADEAAFRRALNHAPQFPSVTELGGTCAAIKREVIEKTGYLSEDAEFSELAAGLSEYCRRVRADGFNLRMADNACVFRSKSAAGSGYDSAHLDSAEPKGHPVPFTVLFLMRFRGGGGGAHSIVQEALGLRRLGVFTQLAIQRTDEDFYRKNYPQAPADLFFPVVADDEVVTISRPFDLVVATLFTSMKTVRLLKALNPGLVAGYYIQDYEPWFVEEDTDLYREALDSYDFNNGVFRFAKTNWLRDTVQARHGVSVHKVTPSIDTDVYYPRADGKTEGSPLIITAMVRPGTPRRSPELTVRVLRALKQEFGDAVEIAIFGCEASDPFWNTVPSDFAFSDRGVLTREEVADLLRDAHLFLDLSTYQAFGRTGLEAMACGCATILPEQGGVHEYAVHGENSLVVDTGDETAIMEAARSILRDAGLRSRLQAAALKTAANYSILKAAESEKALFEKMLVRAGHETVKT